MTVAKEMNNGVALLLERMETHPEEFVRSHKWASIMQEMHKYASKEDSEALNNALRTLMMQSLTEQVLEELVDPKSDGMSLNSMAHPRGTPLGGTTPLRSSGLTLTTDGSGKPVWVNEVHQNHVQLHQQALGALGVNSATQSIGYGAGATNLLKNIFGGNK